MPMFDLQKLNSAPLVFTYPISASISIKTTVTGDARQNVTTEILYGTLTLWSCSAMQLAPTCTIPNDIVAGEITIEKGGGFTLTVPTSSQNGSNTAKLTIKSGTQNVRFNATVATWVKS